MSGHQEMRLSGTCHCGNIRYTLEWPAGQGIQVRACGCTFCTKHGGRWTSHRDARLIATLEDAALVSQYRFGTKTADFHLCARCGAVPFVTSAIEGSLYAVVNVNTFENVERALPVENTANFDGEGTGERLERRKRNWIPDVRIASG
ncbi:MAG: GFA family protein [Betaproteobacteria bacterium]